MYINVVMLACAQLVKQLVRWGIITALKHSFAACMLRLFHKVIFSNLCHIFNLLFKREVRINKKNISEICQI